jgi:hypothetical protein
MPQLTENKQNEPILIANFEPTACADKSAQKVEVQTRLHCTGEPAQKAEVRRFQSEMPTEPLAESTDLRLARLRITIPALLYRASVNTQSAKEKPMRKVFLVFTFCCALSSATLAQYGKPEQPADTSQAAKPDFSMTASYIEACSCDMFCPCYFNSHSTMHGDMQFCRANLVLKVDTGYYKSTKLDGAKVWVSTDLGSDWSTGKDSWVVMTFDPSDTPEQKAALSDILGQLYPFKWEKAATDTVAFSWNVDETTGVAHAKMSNGKGEVVLERVAGTNPKQEVVIPNLQYWQAQSNNGFRMWKTKEENYSGQGHDFDYKGTNGFLITITFSGKATANPAD